MKSGIRFTIIGMALTLLSCSGRDRSNPLDPQNPETGGKVADVRLSAIGHDVTVSWDAVNLSAISAYHVYRKESGAASFSRIGTVPSSRSDFLDPGRSYDAEWNYAVTAQTGAGYQSPLSDSLSILPGPYTFWMCDYYDGSIHRLTYDGRYSITLTRESIWPTAVAADTSRGQIWIADWITGYLYRVNEQGEIELWISGLDNPTLVACDPNRPEIWVVDGDRTRIMRFDGEGQALGVHEGFEYITGLCWSGEPDQFWVADQGLAQIQRIDRSGQVRITYPLSHDAPPVMDSHPEAGWITAVDSLEVMRIHFSGEVDSIATLNRTCYDLSVDRETGGCWMILIGPSEADEVIYLNADGGITVRTEGYYSALAVAAVPGGNGCLVADTGHGRMVRLKPDGEILGELAGLVSPWDVILY
jgi:hypothetical protein